MTTHSTGDFAVSDSGALRGPHHRPERLQVCIDCLRLRGPYGSFDNICRCDREQWQGELPTCGDLGLNVILCMSCLSKPVPGRTRWSPYHCESCQPRVVQLGRLAGRCVVPIGRHSIMNGTFLQPGGGQVGDAQVVAFYDQLTAHFRSQTDLHELSERRLRRRLTELGVTGHEITAESYLVQSWAAGWGPETGFVDFLQAIDQGIDADTASELWILRPKPELAEEEA